MTKYTILKNISLQILFSFYLFNIASAANDTLNNNNHPATQIITDSISERALKLLSESDHYRSRELPPTNLVAEINKYMSLTPKENIAREAIAVREANQQSAYAKAVPTINYFAGIERVHDPLILPVNSDSDIYGASITARYALFEGFSWWNNLKSTNKMLASSLEQYKGVTQGLALNMAQAYVGTLLALCDYESALANYTYHLVVLDIVKNYNGDDKEELLHFIEREQNAVHSTKRDFYFRREKQTINYGLLTDTERDINDYWLNEPPDLKIPNTVEAAIAIALDKNPQLNGLRLAKEAEEKNVQAKVGAFSPRLEVLASAHISDRDSQELGNYNRDGWYAGLQVTGDFDIIGKRAEIAKAESQVRVATANIENERRNIKTNLQVLYSDRHIMTNRLQDLNSAIISAKDALAHSEEQLFLTPDSLRNLLADRNSLFKAEVEHNQLRHALILNSFMILAGTGELTKSLGVADRSSIK